MERTKKTFIQDLEDVQSFAHYLIKDCHVNFHPDTPFEEYINLETGKPTFDSDECETGNSLLEECRVVCEENGTDIYEVMDLFDKD